MLACLTMALAGFIGFGEKTQGNILNNFPDDNLIVNIARFLLGANMVTTLPLECFVCREVIFVRLLRFGVVVAAHRLELLVPQRAL